MRYSSHVTAVSAVVAAASSVDVAASSAVVADHCTADHCTAGVLRQWLVSANSWFWQLNETFAMFDIDSIDIVPDFSISIVEFGKVRPVNIIHTRHGPLAPCETKQVRQSK